MSISYVDFYRQNNISPVSQDISDLGRHFQRRASLFLTLGILPRLVSGQSVLEFGPGSGHNALYTANLAPAKYILVDGNPKGVAETKNRLAHQPVETLEVVLSLFEEFHSSIAFDLVWAEGCLPHQVDAISLVQHMATFVGPGGCLVVTTVDAISLLPEILRRLVKDIHCEKEASLEAQLKTLVPIFEPHLKTLQGRSRPVEDWIVDNILQPFEEVELFSLPQAIQCLSSEFDVYGLSPKFTTDWRWYKDIVGDNRQFNQNTLAAYYRQNLNFLDYRFEYPPHSALFGRTLAQACATVWSCMKKIQKTGQGWGAMWEALEAVALLIEAQAPQTAVAVREASQWIQGGAKAGETLQHFPLWWGRGQQYISFVRK